MLQNQTSLSTINSKIKDQLYPLEKHDTRAPLSGVDKHYSEEGFQQLMLWCIILTVASIKIVCYISFIPVMLLLTGRISGRKGGK
jgi:hypothetical protein